MSIKYFYNSNFIPTEHKKTIRIIIEISKNENLKYECIDVSKYKDNELTKLIEIFGVITFPMICYKNKILINETPTSKHQLSIYLSIAEKLPCLTNSIISY